MTQDKPTIEEDLENKFKPLVWGNTAYTRKRRVEECVLIAKELASLNRQGWTRVEDGLPTENDTSDYWYNEVMTLQVGRRRPTFMKYWEVKNCPFTKYWMPLPKKPI